MLFFLGRLQRGGDRGRGRRRPGRRGVSEHFAADPLLICPPVKERRSRLLLSSVSSQAVPCTIGSSLGVKFEDLASAIEALEASKQYEVGIAEAAEAGEEASTVEGDEEALVKHLNLSSSEIHSEGVASLTTVGCFGLLLHYSPKQHLMSVRCDPLPRIC